MDLATGVLMVAALGVSFGWQPAKDDPQAYEVIMQVEPELLDVLESGGPVPIESHVPAEIAPIRNIRVLVGSGDVPRTRIMDDAKPPSRVVRGQGDVPFDAPQSHTARFQNDGWNDDRYQIGGGGADTRRFEQRGASIGSDSLRTAQAPSPLERAQNAVVETGGVLRDGIEAGIHEANQQLHRAGNDIVGGAASAGREVGQQLQNVTSAAGQQLQRVWPAPPPSSLPAENAAPAVAVPTESSSGWTSVRSDLAPPRILNPPLVPMISSNAGNAAGSGDPGPTFPAIAAGSRAPRHSELADPTAKATQNAAPPNWAAGWGNNTTPATIGSPAGNSSAFDDIGSGLAPLPPRAGPEIPRQPPAGVAAEEDRRILPETTATPVAGGVASNSAADDRYSQPAAPAIGSDSWANFGPPAAGAGESPPDRNSLNQPPANVPYSPPQSPAGQASDQAVIGFANPSPSPAADQMTAAKDEPWLPLLIVSVSLAGSLGANLFLGWSYADARHRYRALVRKTTHSFQRATGVAA